MTTYRLGSSALLHTPGIIAWAINGYAFEEDRPQLLNVVATMFADVPPDHLDQLLRKQVPFTIDSDTVVFTSKEN